MFLSQSGLFRHRTRLPPLQERRQIVVEQIADLGKLNIRGWILGQNFWIKRIMALLGKHRGNPLAPDLLHRSKNVQLVIDEHIVIGRIEALYVFELVFLVNVDEHTIIDRPPQTGPFYLARLEYRIAI